MEIKNKRTIAILLAVCFLVSITATAVSAKGNVIEATSLQQINTALNEGRPVLLSFGSITCEPCQNLQVFLDELASKYYGKATIMHVYVNSKSDMDIFFGVTERPVNGWTKYSVPTSFLIVRTSTNQPETYFYMKSNGQTTSDKSQAKIEGYDGTEQDKQKYIDILNLGCKYLEDFNKPMPGISGQPKIDPHKVQRPQKSLPADPNRP
jgi:thioredoxin 1